MRLSRIDSIMAYLNTNLPSNHVSPHGRNMTLQSYSDLTDDIKVDITKHNLLDVLGGLQKLYYTYPNDITDLGMLDDLQSGTADIYDSINKAVLGPPMSKVPPKPSVKYDGIISYEYIDDFETKYSGENPFIMNGQWVITEWKIDKEGEKITFLRPLKMLHIVVDKNMVKCTTGLEKIFKYDGSPACVKPTTAGKLVGKGWVKPSPP